MGIAIGVLFWRPADFWASSPDEFFAGLDALALSNGSPEADAKERRRKFKQFQAQVENGVGTRL